jgi:hypothetical protein
MNRAPTVNLATRRAYAEVLRHFLAGRLTTDSYENEAIGIMDRVGPDNAVEDIFAACWHLYDDILPHRMTGRHRVGGEMRRRVARWVLFLRCDGDYRSPSRQPGLPENRGVGPAMQVGAGWLGAFAAAAGACLGLVGFPAGIVLLLCGVSLLAILICRGPGVSLNAEVAARAFGDSNDPWPFASHGDLAGAAATPTFLCGR